MRIAPHRSRLTKTLAAVSPVFGMAALAPNSSAASGAAIVSNSASSPDRHPWEVM
jgi:hypothetical protein